MDLTGSRLVSADFCGFVKIWDLTGVNEEEGLREEPPELLSHRSMLSHRTQVTAVAADAARLVSGSRDRTVLIVDFDKSGEGEEDTKVARRMRRRTYF